MSRYSVLWSFYENTTYENFNPWIRRFLGEYGLFTEIDGYFNPVFRLVEFWATHLMGGTIDPEAGDGTKIETAIPIQKADDRTRASIAKLFLDSQWEINKPVWCRFGAALGDVGLEVVNDRKRDQVWLRVIDPRTVSDVQFFANGDVKRYEITDWFADPRLDPESGEQLQAVLYREVVDIVGNQVRYRTYLGDELYPWYEKSTWYLDQDYIPMVFHCHNKISVTMPYGWSEVHTAIPKIVKLNDIASRLTAGVGKTIDAIWLFSGVSPKLELQMPKAQENPNDPKIGIDEIPAIYGPPEARAQALTSMPDVAAVLALIKEMIEDLKQDFPELRPDIESAIGDASGKALRVARQRCEAKANARRPGYDAALTKCIKMALAMGSRFGYEGYQGIPSDPNKINFLIGKRSVFATDPMDKLELEKETWANRESADRAGLPLPGMMALQGESQESIDLVMKSREETLAMGLEIGRSKQASPQGDAAVAASQVPGATAP